MIENLDQLVQHVRQSVPQPSKIQNLEPSPQAGIVGFKWNSQEFVVRKSMQVLEKKGNNLYITGASLLMESTIRQANKNEQVVETAADMLRQAEDMIGNHTKMDVALQLMETVKGTLRRMTASQGLRSKRSSPSRA